MLADVLKSGSSNTRERWHWFPKLPGSRDKHVFNNGDKKLSDKHQKVWFDWFTESANRDQTIKAKFVEADPLADEADTLAKEESRKRGKLDCLEWWPPNTKFPVRLCCTMFLHACLGDTAP